MNCSNEIVLLHLGNFSIFRKKKTKRLQFFGNTVRDLEQRLSISKDSQVKLVGKDPHFKRRRFWVGSLLISLKAVEN